MKIFFLFIFSILAVYFAVATDRFAATTAFVDVQSAYWTCVAGDTLHVPAGTSTWNTFLVLTNPVIILGLGTNNANGATVISNSQMSAYTDAPQGTNPLFKVNLVVQGRLEISGFSFRGLRSNSCIRVDSGGVFPRILVINSNRFEGFYFSLMNNGAWGLLYKNHHFNNDWTLREAGFDTLASLPVSNPESYKWNTTNYMVYEDELFEYNPLSNDRYYVDTDHPANYMFRYCTFKGRRSGSPGCYIFDQHGESSGGSAHVPLGPVFYMNTIDYDGSGDNKIGDIRGGANSLVYSNTVNLSSCYMQYRDDYTPNVNLLTNCYLFRNTDLGGGDGTQWAADDNVDGNGCLSGVNFFTNTVPSDFSQLVYPHPLRVASGGGSAPPNTILGSSINGQAIIIPRSQVTIR